MRLLFALVALLTALPAAAAADPPKPNVVLILADDLGYECVGANGGPYKTPHLDKLAAGGVRFEHCYAQPLCTPTRTQLMTGLYNVRNYTRFGHLDPDQATFAHAFRKAGYATGVAGKWQLGGGFAGPGTFGFDEYCLWQLTRKVPRYANPGLEIDGKEVDYANGEYGPDLVNDWACRFVARHKDRPFLLYYPMLLTHDPFQPPPGSKDWNPKAMGETVNAAPGHFSDMVGHMDKLVGKLVAALDEHKVRERTLILFLGDNGTHKSIRTKLAGGRTVTGGKGTAGVDGMRVPLIANRPGVVPAGKVCPDLIDTTDFFPTLCDAAGVGAPAKPTPDGRSFAPQLRGEKGTPREWVYSWYWPNQGGRPAPPVEFVADRTYRLDRDGTLTRWTAGDPADRTKPLADPLPPDAAAAKEALSAALKGFAGVRPTRLPQPAQHPEKP